MIRKILILFLGMIFLAGFVLGEEGSAVTYGDVSGNETNMSQINNSGNVNNLSSSLLAWIVGIVILIYAVYLAVRTNKKRK